MSIYKHALAALSAIAAYATTLHFVSSLDGDDDDTERRVGLVARLTRFDGGPVTAEDIRDATLWTRGDVELEDELAAEDEQAERDADDIAAEDDRRNAADLEDEQAEDEQAQRDADELLAVVNRTIAADEHAEAQTPEDSREAKRRAAKRRAAAGRPPKR